jgi:predicted metal-dependent peptidase
MLKEKNKQNALIEMDRKIKREMKERETKKKRKNESGGGP